MCTVQQQIRAKIAELAPLAEYFPGVITVHNTRTQGVEYMSPRGLRLLRVSPEELLTMGAEYHSRFFNPEEVQEYLPKIVQLMEQNDFDQVISFFQQVRTTESPGWNWYLSTMRLLARDPEGQPLLLLCFASPVDPTNQVTFKVQRLLEENTFLRQHHQLFAQLTRREREVLPLLALGHSAAEIAERLFISVQTAETHRRNIRQKLGADSIFELGQFARAFNLI
jgi:DNA-binding CsgD family transcriptional regulator